MVSIAFDPTEEVLSGEAVAIDVQPVGLFFRVLGALIDALVSVAVLVAFGFAIAWMGGEGLLSEAAVGIVTIIAAVVSLIVLPCTMETLLRGRSLGKLAIGGRIVRLDGGPTGFRHTFVRAMVGVLEVYSSFGTIAFLAGAFTARSQRLGDLAAGTYCQKVRVPSLALRPIQLPPQLAEWARVADVARIPDRLTRRITQFLGQAGMMSPAARMRVASELVGEVAPFVSPRPQTHDELLLQAVVALRRERDLHALRLSDERVVRLGR